MNPLLNRLLAVAGVFLAASHPAPGQEAVPGQFPVFAATDTEGLRAKEGQKVVAWGETTGSGKSPAGMNFVNFKDAELYLVTFKSDLKPFGDTEPADAYDGKRLVVTGVVSLYKDKVQIKLTSPDQVRVLAGDEPWPKAPPKPEAAPVAEASPAPETSADGEPTEEAPARKPPVDSKLYFK